MPNSFPQPLITLGFVDGANQIAVAWSESPHGSLRHRLSNLLPIGDTGLVAGSVLPFKKRLSAKQTVERAPRSLELRSQEGKSMRCSHALFVAAILAASLAFSVAQSPTPSAPQQSTPAPKAGPSRPATPSETLQSALDGVQKTIGSLKLEKWKKGTIREEAGASINSIQRDLQGTLPSLLKTADAAPGTVSKVLPVSRNIDALYDVLVHIVEGARVAAPTDQVADLQQAMNNLEKARVTLDDHLQDSVTAQEKLVADLRSTVQTQQQSLHAAATAPPRVVPCVTPPPAHKKKRTTPATSTTAPKTSAAPANTPKTAAPASPDPKTP
jgi:hypothetical protein